MYKNEIVSIVARKTGFTKRDTSKFIRIFIDTITEELMSGKDIILTGFGSFSVVNKARRTGRNPVTGKMVGIPTSKTICFKPSDVLKDILI